LGRPTKAIVTELLQQRALSDEAEIEQTLAQMPTPHPGYQLSLQYQDQHFSVDLWGICYQVCFRNYSPHSMSQAAQ